MAQGHAIPLDERTRERLVEASRLATVGRLVPSLVHQLSTPLASIALRAESLERSVASGDWGAAERARRYLEAILRETGACRDLLALAREAARPAPPTVDAVDVNALCRDVASLLLHEAMRRQVQVRLELAEPLPRASGRAGPLRHAVLALVLNAVDASPQGGVVHLASRVVAGDVLVEVDDAGPGVTPADDARLGAPFFTSREDAIGLGLFSARAIAEAQGGGLAWECVPGRTRFTLRLLAHGAQSPRVT